MNIFLRAHEKIYVNGAVIRVDRKTTLELLNEATFLLENHVMQTKDATTPMRRIYFAIQIMLMDPSASEQAAALARNLIRGAESIYTAPELLSGLQKVSSLIDRTRNFESLKTLRALFPVEDEELREIMQHKEPTPA
ncbi:MAG TPA: flagellar biosynthesis repressor FlbT [Methylocella sp.]|nr:flagellar biosynthesis repressor FlbT [Methylocella sp.]